jgi:hypothetical protein
MPKAYSLDLRERVARFVEAGRSCHAAAAHFSVSVSFVVKATLPVCRNRRAHLTALLTEMLNCFAAARQLAPAPRAATTRV